MYFALLPIASYRSRLLVNMVFEFSSFVDAFIRVTLTFNQDSYESLLFELMPVCLLSIIAIWCGALIST